MRTFKIEDEIEQLDFANKAAMAFEKNDKLATYGGQILPGALLALRWGLMDRSVLVVRLDQSHVPTVYPDIITVKNPEAEKAFLQARNQLFQERFSEQNAETVPVLSGHRVLPQRVCAFAQKAAMEFRDRPTIAYWMLNEDNGLTAIRDRKAENFVVLDRWDNDITYRFEMDGVAI